MYKGKFPGTVTVRVTDEDAIEITKKARSTRISASCFARILLAIGLQAVEKDSSLILQELRVGEEVCELPGEKHDLRSP